MNMTNISKHPCANKCSEFKAEQCKHCLISCPEISDNFNYSEIPNSSDFIAGDVVVFIYNYMPHVLMTVSGILGGGKFVAVNGYQQAFLAKDLRHATPVELQQNRRVNKIILDDDMGDDSYLENNISPLCKSYSNDEQIHLSKALDAQKEVS